MKLKLQAADVTRGRSFSERNYSFEQDFTYYTPQPSKSSMNSLVAYDSSDEEDNDSELPKPAKIAKLAPNTTPSTIHHTSGTVQRPPGEGNAPAKRPVNTHIPSETGSAHTAAAPAGPIARPQSNDDAQDSPHSPYTFERQRLRELTMPTVPNFDIPDSPPPPPPNSEEDAALAATTKKIERFLELKKQGIHFNERLQNSSSLRNPSLLPKLMEFAGISREDSHATSLPESLAVPVKWPEDCYIESLLRQNEKKQKKRLADREKLDFVPASKSAQSSSSGTPANISGDDAKRRSRFDKR